MTKESNIKNFIDKKKEIYNYRSTIENFKLFNFEIYQDKDYNTEKKIPTLKTQDKKYFELTTENNFSFNIRSNMMILSFLIVIITLLIMIFLIIFDTFKNIFKSRKFIPVILLFSIILFLSVKFFKIIDLKNKILF